MDKPSKSASRRSKYEVVFIITDASTNTEYRDDNDLIPRNSNVIVVRRPRETFEPLTPATAQQQHISFDDIIDGYFQSAPLSKKSTTAISYGNTSTKATTELELIEDNRTSHICRYCKRYGHIKPHCPLLIGSSTATLCRKIDSTHKSAINMVPPASISPRPHSNLTKSENIVLCDANDTSIEESSPNKSQNSTGTYHVVLVPLPSAFSSSNIFLQQAIDPLSENDDAKLSQIRSVSPFTRPSNRTSRYLPYPIPYGHGHQLAISETQAGISCDNFIPISQETSGIQRDKCGAFLRQNKESIMNSSQSGKRASENSNRKFHKRIKKDQQLVWNDNWLTFEETPKFEEIIIDTKSALKWCPNFLSNEEGDALFKHILQELNFEHTEIKMYGKSLKLPRLQSWFADEGLVVKELFQKQKQHPWTPPMEKLRSQLEKRLGVKFDFCLVNLYRNGDDHINFHADNETRNIIASVSLGVTRRFLLRHISCFGRKFTRKRTPLTTPDTTNYEFSLSNGSLIVMLGDTQLHWKHSVPKEKQIKDTRINLTFRIKQDKH